MHNPLLIIYCLDVKESFGMLNISLFKSALKGIGTSKK
ncbi:hypothetical protein ZONE111904_10690 [Zobellia nedashkovskayae]